MMKRYLLPTLSLYLLLAIVAAPVWSAGLNEVIGALETPFQADTDEKYRIFDYSADFFQESRITSLDRLQRANGRVEVGFDYRQTGTVPGVKFRWQYDQPTTQEIVSNGETLWVYLPENNQVIQSDIEMTNQARENDPMTFLTGLGNLSRDFRISWGVPNYDMDSNYILELAPRKSSALINRLVIVVDRLAVEAYQRRNADETPFKEPILAPPVPTRDDITFPGLEGGVNDIWFPIMSTTVYDPNGNSTTIEFSNLRINVGLSSRSFDFIMPAGVQVVRPTGQEMGF